MDERFSGSVLQGSADGEEIVRSLGEIGLNGFAPYLMNRVMARYNANLAEELKHLDMSTAKVRTLAVLSVTSSATINELSIFAVTEQSTMSRTLDALEEQGYIRRQPRSGDMRVRDVSITEEGRLAFDAAWPTMYGFLLQMFDGIDEDEHRAFVTTLQKILRNVKKNDI
ncbi:MarR family winged helix-turn-helix transcriptional regulator [Rhizobium halophytocola]|uniref:DNA-binding MarR family transcriptional regulator n=1 Tax=Rhizobium halophytocola TaxID=735519 RepID=A0ABS4DVD3_9HYPH|nr:MarR family transcriptional regulator [Rhizobium halophytocola]MBP1849637.1 DNA-binding MarR family transcriptional regulator [Rhizobium halophytocola]